MIKIYFPILCMFFPLTATPVWADETPSAKPTSSVISYARLVSEKLQNIIFSIDESDSQRLARCAKLELSTENAKGLRTATAALKNKEDWLTLVDPQHRLPQDYQPQDLVAHREQSWPKEVRLRQEAFERMTAMIGAAKKDGIHLIPLSTYRTWNYQKMLSNRKPGNPYVALPGESQHHLGTAVDFNTLNPKDENIPELVWLRKHAGEYGFSLSFPKGQAAEQESGYPYEPWHYRYITREAVQLQDKFFNGDQHKTLRFLNDCQPFQSVE